LIEELVDEFTKKCHVCEFLPFVENKVHMKSHVCKGSNPDEDRFSEKFRIGFVRPLQLNTRIAVFSNIFLIEARRRA